jgi:hypothetical protein
MQASTIVLNEDFETPLVSGAPFYTPYVAATTFNGWTVGGVDVAIVSDNFPNTPAQSGHQWLDLMGLDQGGGNITQTIATTAGQQYNVSFWVGNVTSLPGTSSTVEFRVDENLVLTATNSTNPSLVQSWQQFTTSFIASGPLTVVGFFNADVLPDVNNGVDNILITTDVANTPLPAALPLFAGGLGAFGWLGWRRKRKLAAVAA